jgi:mannitol-1-phosphate 5-dehydrogenase
MHRQKSVRRQELPPRVMVFGAGQIGRGFIGDICSASGYHLVFVDINESVVRMLNEKGSYPLWLLAGEEKKERRITNISALNFSQTDKIAEEIVQTDIVFTAVGGNNLQALGPILAEGIKKKAGQKPTSNLNIVICENILGGANILKNAIQRYLPVEFLPFLNENTGFVETVVSRMVSPLSEEMRKKHPLLVTVEPYNILPVEKNKFRGIMPPVKGFYPVEDLFPYEELKLFIHNLSHACLAYAGYFRGHTYIWEALKDKNILTLLKGVLTEARSALIKKHNFEKAEIDNYISDLIARFGNRSLGDTVQRVGRDPLRKIGKEDRIAGGIKLCLSQNVYPENISFVMAYCLCYNYQNDEKAVKLQDIIKEKGVLYILEEISGIKDSRVVNEIIEDYNGLKNEGGAFKKD